jgi:hypothetical protein
MTNLTAKQPKDHDYVALIDVTTSEQANEELSIIFYSSTNKKGKY